MCTASPANGRNCEPVTLTSIGLEYQVDLWRSRYKLHRPGGESTVFVISCHLSQVFWQVIAIMKPYTPIIRIPFLSSIMWWTCRARSLPWHKYQGYDQPQFWNSFLRHIFYTSKNWMFFVNKSPNWPKNSKPNYNTDDIKTEGTN